MADGGSQEIKGTVSLDLSSLRASLDAVDFAQKQADARTEAVVRRVRVAETQVTALQRFGDKVTARLKGISKGLIRGGLAAGLQSTLSELESGLGDDPYVQAGARIFASTAVAGAFGGVAPATITFIISSIQELSRANAESKRQLADLEKKLRDGLAKAAEETFGVQDAIRDAREDLKEERKKEAEKLKAEVEELDYQTSQYAE